MPSGLRFGASEPPGPPRARKQRPGGLLESILEALSLMGRQELENSLQVPFWRAFWSLLGRQELENSTGVLTLLWDYPRPPR